METQTSQPEFKGGVAAFETALQAQQSAEPQTAAPEPVAEAPVVPDPATIQVPVHDTVPEKFRNKFLPDVFKSLENAERFMHEKAGEAAQARRENEELKARLAAAEQVSRMLPKPEPQKPVDPWGGVNPSEAVITDTPRFVDTTVSMARQEAIAAAQAEARRIASEEAQKLRDQASAAQLINTFETARATLKDKGFDVSDEKWHPNLAKVARILKVENDAEPGALFDTKRYVNYYSMIAENPTPRATIPTEGNPPVASKAASGPSIAQTKPTISREQRQLYTQIGEAAGLKGDQLKSYIERMAEQGGAR